MVNDKKKVLVVYHSFAHYRSGVVEALADSEQYDFTFCGSADSYDSTIKLMQFSEDIPFENAKLKFFGPFMFQKNLKKIIDKQDYKTVILLGNPYILSYWVSAIKLRLKGVPVLFWTHGWVNSKDSFLKRTLRNTFYRISNGLLLYGERAKKLGLNHGFRDEELFVISNSLDFTKMRETFSHVKQLSKQDVREELKIPQSSRVLICSARLIESCRFDLLIESAAELIKQGHEAYVLLIGDGLMRSSLTNLAEELSVPLQITGACYDEELISKYFYAADVAVSPGKVGLSVIHSLTYETPMITNNNFDVQGPEYEAIIPDETGDFFRENDVADLTMTVAKWLKYTAESNYKIGQKCNDRVEHHFSPGVQRREIESAIDKVIS